MVCKLSLIAVNGPNIRIFIVNYHCEPKYEFAPAELIHREGYDGFEVYT